MSWSVTKASLGSFQSPVRTLCNHKTTLRKEEVRESLRKSLLLKEDYGCKLRIMSTKVMQIPPVSSCIYMKTFCGGGFLVTLEENRVIRSSL